MDGLRGVPCGCRLGRRAGRVGRLGRHDHGSGPGGRRLGLGDVLGIERLRLEDLVRAGHPARLLIALASSALASAERVRPRWPRPRRASSKRSPTGVARVRRPVRGRRAPGHLRRPAPQRRSRAAASEPLPDHPHPPERLAAAHLATPVEGCYKGLNNKPRSHAQLATLARPPTSRRPLPARARYPAKLTPPGPLSRSV